jgi:hypothetical protein
MPSNQTDTDPPCSLAFPSRRTGLLGPPRACRAGARARLRELGQHGVEGQLDEPRQVVDLHAREGLDQAQQVALQQRVVQRLRSVRPIR